MDKDKAPRLCDRSHSARIRKLPIIGTSGDSNKFQILSHVASQRWRFFIQVILIKAERANNRNVRYVTLGRFHDWGSSFYIVLHVIGKKVKLPTN